MLGDKYMVWFWSWNGLHIVANSLFTLLSFSVPKSNIGIGQSLRHPNPSAIAISDNQKEKSRIFDFGGCLQVCQIFCLWRKADILISLAQESRSSLLVSHKNRGWRGKKLWVASERVISHGGGKPKIFSSWKELPEISPINIGVCR